LPFRGLENWRYEMKMRCRIFVVILICTCAVTAWSGETQYVAAGEVPEGITADDWGIVQEAYLKASNTGPDGFFALVAISGDTIVVGAGGESSLIPRELMATKQITVPPLLEPPMCLSVSAA
jgi:hypothetical protein